MNPQIVDLTCTQINVTDYIIIETLEHRFVWKVLSITGEAGEKRQITCRRISSSDKQAKSRQSLEFLPGTPVMGMCVPEAEYHNLDDIHSDAGVANNVIITELERYLKERVQKRNRSSYNEAVRYLTGIGVMPPKVKYETNRDHLSAIIRANPELFEVSGGHIHLINTRDALRAQRENSEKEFQLRPVEIDIVELHKAVESLFKSGAMTGGRPVKFVGMDGTKI